MFLVWNRLDQKKALSLWKGVLPTTTWKGIVPDNLPFIKELTGKISHKKS
jgi:hypothetical protein